MSQQLHDQPLQILAGFIQALDRLYHGLNVAGEHMFRQLLQERAGDQAKDRKHILFGDVLAFERNNLIQRGLRIAESTLCTTRDGQQCVVFDCDLLRLGDLPEALHDQP